MNSLSWRKVSYSNGDGGDYVELSDDLPGIGQAQDRLTRPETQSLTFLFARDPRRHVLHDPHAHVPQVCGLVRWGTRLAGGLPASAVCPRW
ncbi:hypothetical protein [Streptomyces virginiae]|uniref:hypothetical protein n=1 Tax=Streptomyces virginiae TaxID=1961 RepID=UPI003868F06D